MIIGIVAGKFDPILAGHVQSIINEMSILEKKRILTETFETLWNDMWGQTNNAQYKNEEQISSKKFDIIKEGIIINNEIINNEITEKII